MLFHITLKSSNAKTGPIPVSTSSAETCPPSCGMFSACYAKSGPLAIHWQTVNRGNRGMSFGSFCASIAALPIGQLWRHNQAGDLPGIGDSIDSRKLSTLVNANRGKHGFTYTHKPTTAANLAAIRHANANGFTVNLSCDSIAEIDRKRKHRLPMVCVLPGNTVAKSQKTPKGKLVVTCPATLRNTTCEQCGLCADAKRSFAIGFLVHGSLAKHWQA